jgi:hypothetical protein
MKTDFKIIRINGCFSCLAQIKKEVEAIPMSLVGDVMGEGD